MANRPDDLLRDFETEVGALKPEQQGAFREAAAAFLERGVPALQPLSRGRQKAILIALTNVIYDLITDEATRRIQPENVPRETPLHIVLNQLRADPPRQK